MAQNWSVSGSYFESCNCEAACPCVFLSPPTEGACSALVAWHIEKGAFDGAKLDGRSAALFAHTDGHMAKTPWKVALYIDDKATEQQRDAIGKIFSGQAGGHLANLVPLIGELLGVKTAAMDYRAEGKRRSLRIAGIGEMEIQAIEGQGGADVTIANHPLTPVAGEPAVVSRSKQLKFRDHGFDVQVSDRNGFYSAFAYHG